MAIAGLHNLSSFGPFFGESQSPVSSQWGDEPGMPSTRASSLLQMWRELEGHHVVSYSHRLGGQGRGPNSECSSISNSVVQRSNIGRISDDVDGTGNQVVPGSETDHDDNNSIVSEQSSDLGEMERGRVRQIFKEWMSSGAVGNSANGLHLKNHSGPQWLGENECERVRIIREWVQMNSQQRNNRGSVREGGAESGTQIEQVREGLVVSRPEVGARRSIRRLCGRQTLLDLLQRVQCERKEELQGLLEQRPVSDFTHHNRIKAFLRGRFLRNESAATIDRQPSVAATDLGLLRQRHTVSGIREGFLSKLENSASTSANSAETDSWFGDQNNGEPGSPCRQNEMMEFSTASDTEIAVDGNLSRWEFVREATEVEGTVLFNVGTDQEVFSDVRGSLQEVSLDIRSTQVAEEQDLGGATEQEVLVAEVTGRRGEEEINANVTNELPLETEYINQSRIPEVFNEQNESGSGLSSRQASSAHVTDLHLHVDRDEPASSQVDELHDSLTETQEMESQQLTNDLFTEWSDGHGELLARSWQENSSNQVFPQTNYNYAVEQDQVQESHEEWPNHGLQEAIDSWLDMPSSYVDGSARRVDTFYFSDDENAHSMELRELFSRRRVSSLLRSSFRESLDQVLQSHVERQGHASGDWELDYVPSSPNMVEQDHRQQNSDRTLDLSDASNSNPFVSQPLWDEQVHDSSLSDNVNQHLRMEWDAVNELRIEMARLQHRLNNMQTMLEQCMEMQVELQRSVRQEVSAALNRSILIRDACKGTTLQDESQWEFVRRGVCCLCRDSNIDSLLYRCGHMCTCSRCAENLVHRTGKCPMCRAPVVEAVRAYLIQ